MPKCLDCGNTKQFSYDENSYNEAEYNEDGDLVDVFYKDYETPTNVTCLPCQSQNVEGEV